MTNELAQPASAAPAGWYPDPHGAPMRRWWDGYTWTDHVAPTERPYGEHLPAAHVPDGTPVDTLWIWLAVLLPLVSLAPILLVDVDQLAATNIQTGSPFGDLWYNIAALLGWPLYGLTVWFAYLDFAALGRLAYGRRFHWAWSFIGSLVYVIGRFVVVRRQSGRGPASLWAAIAVVVCSTAVSSWLFVRLVEAMFSATMTAVGQF
ncbi:DUF2510 domain-containing protein [Agromyces sp. Leaf222]|uniref:DUF2510 domain-containing protein n=1 Tax=Agromyces sp. Leaf222 TaxID=1735688 RepID=UPI00070049A9|nr:DUF2510 domain-containing protein [Agromyces sp. Leaf222]KQM81902.1 hypothetical protein ASE68_00020 [Agromyces sp. Leaf222]